MKVTVEDILKLFGVEAEEKFMVGGSVYRIGSEGRLWSHYGACDTTVTDFSHIIGKEITRFPWEPKYGEFYWFPTPSETKVCATQYGVCKPESDKWRAKNGLCFRTEKEAEAKWRELYGEKESGK